MGTLEPGDTSTWLSSGIAREIGFDNLGPPSGRKRTLQSRRLASCSCSRAFVERRYLLLEGLRHRVCCPLRQPGWLPAHQLPGSK